MLNKVKNAWRYNKVVLIGAVGLGVIISVWNVAPKINSVFTGYNPLGKK